MKLILKQVGECTHMEAEGTPEELAAFVARAFPELRVDPITPPSRTVTGVGRATLAALPPIGGVGVVAFER